MNSITKTIADLFTMFIIQSCVIPIERCSQQTAETDEELNVDPVL